MKLLGIAGKAGVGKDTAAAALVEIGWQRIGFADALKEMLRALDPMCGNCIWLSDLLREAEFEDVKREWPEVRRLLQRLGTEAARNVLGEDVWINAVHRRIEALRSSASAPPGVVIPDVRYRNEAEWIQSRGGAVLLLERDAAEPVADHPSEACAFDADAIYENNDSIYRLKRFVRGVANETDDNPTPEEIAARRDAIRASWTPDVARARRYDLGPVPAEIPYVSEPATDVHRAE